MEVLEARPTPDGKTVAFSRERIACQVRRLPCEEIYHIHTQPICAFIEEGEGEVPLPRFLGLVFLQGASSVSAIPLESPAKAQVGLMRMRGTASRHPHHDIATDPWVEDAALAPFLQWGTNRKEPPCRSTP